MCQGSHFFNVFELVGGGSVINGAFPVYFNLLRCVGFDGMHYHEWETLINELIWRISTIIVLMWVMYWWLYKIANCRSFKLAHFCTAHPLKGTSPKTDSLWQNASWDLMVENCLKYLSWTFICEISSRFFWLAAQNYVMLWYCTLRPNFLSIKGILHKKSNFVSKGPVFY